LRSIFQLPARFCAVAMVNILKAPAYATVAGKVRNVMYPSASVLIPRVEVTVPASKGTVSVPLAIKEKTAKKVGPIPAMLRVCCLGFGVIQWVEKRKEQNKNLNVKLL